MKRRKFIKGSVIVATGGALSSAGAVASTSRYGTPGSLSKDIAIANLSKDKLKLSLSKINVPVEAWGGY